MNKFIKYNRIITTLLMFVFILNVSGQFYFGQNNSSKQKVAVRNESKQAFKFPWAGGINASQFGELDLNLDGIKDLVVFERHGNRLMTFVNGGQPGTIDYTFAPEFSEAFPEIHDWVILKDYNNDGKADIFTYSFEYPGIVVYKNTSQNELKFELVAYPFLTSLQGSGYVNILVTSVDYPGIEDIDNDGDLDILTFWGLGSFVEYHQNQSMELYGIPDSLTFIEVSQCWGYFAENEESNILYLDTCLSKSNQEIDHTMLNERHTGSTFLLLDLDADTDKDLLLGDVDYPNLIELVNGGSPEEAYMVSQNPDFPSSSIPIDLFSMPVAAFIDINNNAINDLIVSSFDPNPITSENHKSVWAYLNNEENNFPQFSFFKNNFLQEDMLDLGSGAYPVLADYNGDGLHDLFVSNFGYYMWSYYTPGMLLKSVYWSNIALFENTGTNEQPEFTRVTHDFASLHSLQLTGIYPSFADLDADDDLDLLFGQQDGTLTYLENIAEAGESPVFAEPITNYYSIDVGDFSAPQLFDLNNNGLFDLSIGEKGGNLNYYKNIGTPQNPIFEYVTDSLGKVNVTNYNISYDGYSTPCFFRMMDDSIELIVGSEQGKIFYFKDIENNLAGKFTENDSLFFRVGDTMDDYNHGIRLGAAIGNLSNDDNFDLIIGNYAGGLNYYQQIKNPPVAEINELSIESYSLTVYPNPSNSNIYFKSDKLTNKDVNLVIFDITLKQIVNSSFLMLDEKEFNISKFESGVYYFLITVPGSKDSYSGRFIKVN